MMMSALIWAHILTEVQQPTLLHEKPVEEFKLMDRGSCVHIYIKRIQCLVIICAQVKMAIVEERDIMVEVSGESNGPIMANIIQPIMVV